MTGQRTEHTGAAPRLLRRRISDRVLGGVAGGLGDYFAIDPLLIRIAFVGLMIFGGAGLVLYVVGWLLIPAEGDEVSTLEGLFQRVRLTPSRVFAIAVLALVVVVLANSWNPGIDVNLREGPLGIPGAVWALIIIMAGVILVRRRETALAVSAAPVVADNPAAAIVVVPRRPPSPLGWYVVAAALISVGLLAIMSQVAEQEVAPGQFFGATLAVLGIGLVVGAWWGRARILILLALLLVPLGAFASFVTAPLEGGIGDHRYAPVTVAELQDEYRLLGGSITLDLTNLTAGTDTFHIAASVAVGQLLVILPEGASIELHTRVGAGDAIVLGNQDVGTSLDKTLVRHRLHQTTYVLDLEAGIGEIYVAGPAGH